MMLFDIKISFISLWVSFCTVYLSLTWFITAIISVFPSCSIFNSAEIFVVSTSQSRHTILIEITITFGFIAWFSNSAARVTTSATFQIKQSSMMLPHASQKAKYNDYSFWILIIFVLRMQRPAWHIFSP